MIDALETPKDMIQKVRRKIRNREKSVIYRQKKKEELVFLKAHSQNLYALCSKTLAKAKVGAVLLT